MTLGECELRKLHNDIAMVYLAIAEASHGIFEQTS